MSYYRTEQLLLPVNPWFIVGSLVFALLLNMLPLGRFSALPDFLVLVVVFWNLHQPLRVGMGWAFILGIAMDVHQGGLLGQHAASYATLCFFALAMHRRLMSFSVIGQALQLLPVFALGHGIELALRLLTGGALPNATLLLAPLFEAALWPVVSAILLAPQRRALNPDVNRPL